MLERATQKGTSDLVFSYHQCLVCKGDPASSRRADPRATLLSSGPMRRHYSSSVTTERRPLWVEMPCGVLTIVRGLFLVARLVRKSVYISAESIEHKSRNSGCSYTER